VIATEPRRGRPLGTHDPEVLPLDQEILARARTEEGWSLWTIAKRGTTIYAGPTLADGAGRALKEET
jgi:hypothetical protein